MATGGEFKFTKSTAQKLSSWFWVGLFGLLPLHGRDSLLGSNKSTLKNFMKKQLGSGGYLACAVVVSQQR